MDVDGLSRMPYFKHFTGNQRNLPLTCGHFDWELWQTTPFSDRPQLELVGAPLVAMDRM